MVVIPAQAGIQTRVYPRTRNRRRHCHSHLHRHSGQFCVLSNKTRLPCHTVLGPSWLKAGPSGSSQTGRKVRSGDNGTKWDGNQKFFVPRHMERCPSALISAFCPLAGGGNGTSMGQNFPIARPPGPIVVALVADAGFPPLPIRSAGSEGKVGPRPLSALPLSGAGQALRGDDGKVL